MQEIRSTISTSLLPEGNTAVPSRYVGRSALLDILYGYKGGKPNITSRNKVKRKTIAAVGTHVYSLKQSHLDVMESVFGQKGFSRNSVDSIGINIYTGMKSSPRVIPNPL